ncbi:uncharacterized protein DEA37_0006357 [Paragonimus westermani]|uniref:Tegument antigen n=1 Tax=Paragonimus westermani TaxID=34504 RepID=A0A5J4NNI3_9TREM|nr:uncharacterized protein DEA37_0006357 [Paragonimus westermani]
MHARRYKWDNKKTFIQSLGLNGNVSNSKKTYISQRMDASVKQFVELDTEHKEYLLTDDLDNLQKEKKLKDNVVAEWKSKFDKNNTGKITLSELCKVQGVDIKEARKQYGTPPPELADVEIIETDMPEAMRVKVCQMIDEGMETHEKDEAGLVNYLKKELDSKFGRLWHVVTVYGRYYTFYTYEMGYNFTFKKNDRIFIVYKTPDCEELSK